MKACTHFIAEDLVQWAMCWHKNVHSCQPQAEKAVVDALHQHNLQNDENRVPDVASEVATHCGLKVQMQRKILAGPAVNRYAIHGVSIAASEEEEKNTSQIEDLVLSFLLNPIITFNKKN